MRRILLLLLSVLLLMVSCPGTNAPEDEDTTITGEEGPTGGSDPNEGGDPTGGGDPAEGGDPTGGGDPAEGGDPIGGGEPIPTPQNAMDAVRAMKLGVNIGNSFDSLNSTNVATQTGWGNPSVSEDYIKSLKKHGFTTVRFPVSWADYIGPGPDYTVDDIWLNMRITRVVDWILAEDMYCIINVHHDGADIDYWEDDRGFRYAIDNVNIEKTNGDQSLNTDTNRIVYRKYKSWIPEMIDPAKEADVKAKYTALWRQIAECLKDRSDKLVFESLNEPQFDRLWNRYAGGQTTEKTKAFRLLNELNQIFVDTVRGTGGNNATRFLLISSYWTDIDVNVENWGTFAKMPTDTAANKLILSFHYYTPWNWCGGNDTTWTNTTQLNNQFNKVKTNFIDKGIPVIIGEYGVNININGGAVSAAAKNSTSRINWMLGVTQKCVELGICPILWDTGMRDNNKGMADVERDGQLRITADLKAMIDGVVWP